MRKDGSHVIVTAFAFVTAIAIGAEADDPSTPTCEALAERIGEIMTAERCDAELDRLKVMAGECSKSHAGVRSALSALAGWAAKHPECVPDGDLRGDSCRAACEAGGGSYDGEECQPPDDKVAIGCFVVEIPKVSGGGAIVTSPARKPAPPPDKDGDGVSDWRDNCIRVMNGPRQAEVPRVGNQTDSDGDGIGDACQYATRNELRERDDSLQRWLDALKEGGVGDPAGLRDLVREFRAAQLAVGGKADRQETWRLIRSLVMAIDFCQANGKLPVFGSSGGEEPVVIVRKCAPNVEIEGLKSGVSSVKARVSRLERRAVWTGFGAGFGRVFYPGTGYSETGFRLDALVGLTEHTALSGGMSYGQAESTGNGNGRSFGGNGLFHVLTDQIEPGIRFDIGLGAAHDQTVSGGGVAEFTRTSAAFRPGLLAAPTGWMAIRVFADLGIGKCDLPSGIEACSNVGFGLVGYYTDR